MFFMFLGPRGAFRSSSTMLLSPSSCAIFRAKCFPSSSTTCMSLAAARSQSSRLHFNYLRKMDKSLSCPGKRNPVIWSALFEHNDVPNSCYSTSPFNFHEKRFLLIIMLPFASGWGVRICCNLQSIASTEKFRFGKLHLKSYSPMQ